MPTPVAHPDRRLHRRAPRQRPAPDRRRGPPRARRRHQRLVQRRLQARAARQDRLRAPVRARDVPGLEARGQGRAHRPRPGRRRHDERHDLARSHELLRDACRPISSTSRLWLEADRMATLLDALSQENLDNQREVVKNEKRWSYDNRPYGTWQEKLQAHLYPPEHPYHHSTIGSMADLDAASLEDVERVLPDLLRAEQRGHLGRRRRRHRGRPSQRRALLRRHPGEPGHPAARRPVAAADARWRDPRDRLRPGAAAAHLRRLPRAGLRRSPPGRARGRRPDPRRWQGQPAASPARPRRADRPGRRAVHARVHRRRVDPGRLGHGPPGRDGRAGRGGAARGARAARHRSGQRRRAGPRLRPDRGGRARRAPARRGTRRPAVDVRDAVRRPEPHQRDAAALPGGDAGGDPRGRGRDVPARQPARADLPARDAAGRFRGRRRRRREGSRRRPPSRTRRWPHDRHRPGRARRLRRRRAPDARARRGRTTSPPSPGRSSTTG